MSSKPSTADIHAKNKRLFERLKAGCSGSDLAAFAKSLHTLKDFFRQERAYYADARPVIINILLTAHDNLVKLLAGPVPDEPALKVCIDRYLELLSVVHGWQSKFLELELQKNLQRLYDARPRHSQAALGPSPAVPSASSASPQPPAVVPTLPPQTTTVQPSQAPSIPPTQAFPPTLPLSNPPPVAASPAPADLSRASSGSVSSPSSGKLTIKIPPISHRRRSQSGSGDSRDVDPEVSPIQTAPVGASQNKAHQASAVNAAPPAQQFAPVPGVSVSASRSGSAAPLTSSGISSAALASKTPVPAPSTAPAQRPATGSALTGARSSAIPASDLVLGSALDSGLVASAARPKAPSSAVQIPLAVVASGSPTGAAAPAPSGLAGAVVRIPSTATAVSKDISQATRSAAPVAHSMSVPPSASSTTAPYRPSAGSPAAATPARSSAPPSAPARSPDFLRSGAAGPSFAAPPTTTSLDSLAAESARGPPACPIAVAAASATIPSPISSGPAIQNPPTPAHPSSIPPRASSDLQATDKRPARASESPAMPGAVPRALKPPASARKPPAKTLSIRDLFAIDRASYNQRKAPNQANAVASSSASAASPTPDPQEAPNSVGSVVSPSPFSTRVPDTPKAASMSPASHNSADASPAPLTLADVAQVHHASAGAPPASRASADVSPAPTGANEPLVVANEEGDREARASQPPGSGIVVSVAENTRPQSAPSADATEANFDMDLDAPEDGMGFGQEARDIKPEVAALQQKTSPGQEAREAQLKRATPQKRRSPALSTATPNGTPQPASTILPTNSTQSPEPTTPASSASSASFARLQADSKVRRASRSLQEASNGHLSDLDSPSEPSSAGMKRKPSPLSEDTNKVIKPARTAPVDDGPSDDRGHSSTSPPTSKGSTMDSPAAAAQRWESILRSSWRVPRLAPANGSRPTPADIFGPDRQLVACMKTCKGGQVVSSQFTITPDVMAGITNWVSRHKHRDVSGSRCLSLTCHTVAASMAAMRTDADKDPLGHVICEWPTTGKAWASLRNDKQPVTFSLCPPYIVTNDADNTVEYSNLVSLGKNRLEITYSQLHCGLLFALWLHMPTAAQISEHEDYHRRRDRLDEGMTELRKPFVISWPDDI
ncbi:hypothetical protein PUNSTDRAFT_143311 [Punctularia strigosozonata HHB-11173 SS5]|uniref:uncharacterized protein n=1 Tax=Punctularia strigosozonata (strain HHB-11173) TaxID=741275 RepID=UPI0004417E3D|nr:uncharacterized protein PUNSTDRAFT_143311 [Punctularia strigosozonata HHB-11173 SS5]EIN09919.1 hypothetical protein PUNSTDRAFT_143311 [Punctularia strigosozonata HHB-11173 SS5]